MENRFANRFAGSNLSRFLLLSLGAVLFLASASSVDAQQKDKKKKKDAQSSNVSSALPISDEVQIDYVISEMLGAWQIGDIEKLRKDYADDVSFVNGGWAPPVIGWANFLATYQQQRAHIQQVRMDRSNTYIKVSGELAWVCYQWDFSARVDDQPSAARGQTTLVLEKRNNHWMIVHNHTSLVETGQPAPPATSLPAAQPRPNSRPPL